MAANINGDYTHKKSKSKRVQALLLDIFIILAVASLVVLWLDSKDPKIEYEVHEVKRGNIENVTLATGKISPRNMVQIKPQISGIIARVMKEPGDKVTVDEVIASISVVPEMASLNAAQARVEVAEINFALARDNHDRQRILYDKKVISKQEMDRYEAEYKKAQVEINNSRDNLQIVRSGVSMSTGGHTRVRSTINGTVLNVPVKVGTSVIQSNSFNDGTTIATVADMSDMIFVGNIDETEIDKVYAGMPVIITIGALEKRAFDAQLEYIAPQGVEINGAILFEIKAAVDIPEDVTIRAGYSANAEMVLSRAADVLVIPESCVHFNEEEMPYVYVYYKDKNGTNVPEECYVTLGLSDGVNVEVASECLEEGSIIRGNVKP